MGWYRWILAAKWFTYVRAAILIVLIMFLFRLWGFAMEEAIWFSHFPMFQSTFLRIVIAILIILLPWPGLFMIFKGLWTTRVFTGKTNDRLRLFLQSRPAIAKLDTATLWYIIFVLVFYVVLASSYAMLEVPMDIRLRNFVPILTRDIHSWIDFLDRAVQVLSAVVRSTLGYLPSKFLLSFFGGMIVLRLVFRALFPYMFGYTDTYILQRTSQFTQHPNGVRLFAYVIVSTIFLGGIAYIFRQTDSSFRTGELYVEPIGVNFIIHSIDTKELQLTGTLELKERYHVYTPQWCDEFSCSEAEGVPPIIVDSKFLYINGELTSINPKIGGLVKDLEIRLNGSDYLFPFNTYKASIEICGQRDTSAMGSCYSVPNLIDNTEFYVRIDGDNRSFRIYPGEGSLDFYIQYGSYYKLLVFTIVFALFAFLIVTWQTEAREQLTEISVGIFAAMITLRGFIIPQDLTTTPLLLDQILLVYLGLFLFTLLYKYSTTDVNTA